MDEMKKLFQVKRIFAMILAAAMVITMMPTTANAASISDNASAETQEANETSADTTTPDDDGSVVDESVSLDAVGETETVSETEAVTQLDAEGETLVFSLEDGVLAGDKTAIYNGDYPFAYVAYSIYIKVNGIECGTLYDYLEGSLDEIIPAESKTITTTWKKTGGAAIEGYPVNAGAYDLVVEWPNVTDALTITGFEITKTSTTADVVEIKNVKPGTKAGEVTVSGGFSVKSNSSTDVFRYSDDAAVSELSIGKITVKDPYTGKEVGADEALRKGVDYAVEFTVAFTDKVAAETQANFVLPDKVYGIVKIGSLIETKVEVTLADIWKKEGQPDKITQPYVKGTAVKEPVEGTDYTVKVSYYGGEDEEGNDIWTQIPDAKPDTAWYNAQGDKIERPEEAGTYTYRLVYNDEGGIYEGGTYDEITVEIEKVMLTIKPELPADVKFYAGTRAQDVLSKVTYKVLDADGADITTSLDIEKTAFWGSTYWGVNKEQPYQPIFRIDEVLDTDPVSYNENISVLESGKSYRVVFTGNKGYYTADGQLTYYAGINSGSGSTSGMNKNYAVDIAKSQENGTAFTADQGNAATIWVDELLEGEDKTVGKTIDAPIKEVYGETNKFPTRAAYKKATVNETSADGAKGAEIKDEKGTAVKNTHSALNYTWYQNRGTDENPVWYSQRQIPTQAGTYKLVVAYTDSRNMYHADNAEVYYKIEPQKVKVTPTEELTAYVGDSVSDFIAWHDYEFTHEISTAPDEGEGKKLSGDWVYDDSYTINWGVQKQTDAETDTWDWVTGTFEAGGKYRLAVRSLTLYGSLRGNYVDYKIVTETDGSTSTVSFNETKEITLSAVGTGTLGYVVDPSNLTTVKDYDGVGVNADSIAKFAVGNTPVQIAADRGGIYWYDLTNDLLVKEAVNGGSYVLVAKFLGDENYSAFADEDGEPLGWTDITLTIRPIDLVIIPGVNDNLVAGANYRDALDLGSTQFEGVAEADKEAFTYRYYEPTEGFWYAVDGYYYSLIDAAGNQNRGTLKAGNYTVEFSVDLADCTYEVGDGTEYAGYDYSRNYGRISFVPQDIEVVHGTSTVRGTSKDKVAAVTVNDETSGNAKDGYKHTLTVKQGISYYYDGIYNRDAGETQYGNFVAIQITKPVEYSSIPSNAFFENSIKAAGGFNVSANNKTITAIFNVSDEKTTKEFEICWEEGYVEQFKLDINKDVLLSDLTKAVAPKSIAFNKPGTKMVVGEEQQLDVKLTKQQESDTIHLSYKVSDDKVLYVSESGYVTAVGTGKAEVTVYASRAVEGKPGEFEEITPVKKATVKITVNEVAAPKIKGVTVKDNSAVVSFTNVSNGYRKEIYVLEGKQTAGAFETAIANKTGFAITPIYESYNSLSGTYSVKLNGLKREREYTVYVRNVSGIRTVSGDIKVAESHNGAVKTFKTTKSQVTALNLFFNDGKVTTDDNGDYTVKLSEKTAAVSVEGLFRDLDEAAESYDRTEWKELLLKGADLQQYLNPKLIYYVGTISSDGSTGYLVDLGGGKYLRPTTWASINKKGKLKLSGVGEVVVYVCDTNTGEYDYEYLSITASANSITGKKNVKLQVGQSILLSDLLIYKEDKKVLTGEFDRLVVADKAVREAVEGNEYFELSDDGYWITAVKGGGSLSLTLQDAYVGQSADVSLKSADLEPVKNLKIVDVTDKGFKAQFTHVGTAEAFRIVVTDARGSLLRSAYVTKSACRVSGNNYEWSYGSGLTKKSKYNVSITALYGDAVSKVTKKAFTTTLMPASYEALANEGYDINGDFIHHCNNTNEGVEIHVWKADQSDTTNHRGSYKELDETALVSGNTYTLVLAGGKLNAGAKNAVTDTLTWTSKDTKVLTVKANPGTYTATMKAVGKGSTIIEVKSKIKKAVIARYHVSVSAVGTASGYYGDNERLQEGNISNSVRIYGTLELGIIKADAASDQYKLYQFIAPEDATYNFSVRTTSGAERAGFWFFRDTSIGNTATLSELRQKCFCNANMGVIFSMKKGEVVYIAAGGYRRLGRVEFEIEIESN